MANVATLHQGGQRVRLPKGDLPLYATCPECGNQAWWWLLDIDGDDMVLTLSDHTSWGDE